MFRLLGPLEFFDGERWSAIGAPKQRALLAVLLINAGHTVSADQLIAELWGERPPASAAGLLAGYVWRLRRKLGDTDGRTLRTRAPGYQLVLPPGATDVETYDELVATGRHAITKGDLGEAVAALSKALDLWRGTPLADVALVPSVLAESARLEEERLSVVEARIDSEIGLGRHESLLPELKLMVSQFPLRERLHGHLMTALYRGGQQAEALGAYRDLRRLLVDELGVEPSKPLRELQSRILRADPTLHVPTGRQPSVPHTLPPDVPVFVGREQELAWITERLTADRRCALHGVAGVGKTALAVHAAHRLAPSFPDGQVYLDLGACGTPLSQEEAIGGLLAALGVPEPPSGAEAATLLQATLADRRILIVLDDVLDTAQISHLLPAGAAAVLLAGRPASAAVGGKSLLRVGRLPTPAAIDLLLRYAGRGSEEDAMRIAELCDHLPLALRIAATRLARRPEWTVQDFVDRLEKRRLDTLECDGLSVRDSLRAGARLLARLAGTSAAQALGVRDRPVVSAAELDVPEQIAESLVDAGLAEPLSIDRYRVSPLVRLFVDGACNFEQVTAAARSDSVAAWSNASKPHN